QSLLDLHKGTKASRLESMKQIKQAVAREGSSAAHDKYYEFDNTSAINSDATQDLYDDNPQGDDGAGGFRVFMYNKSTKPLKSTYLSPTVTCSFLKYIQSLLNETPVNELTDFMSNPVYIDAHTTSVVANPEGNSEAAHNSSPLANKTSYPTKNPQHNLLQAKAKRLIQKAKKNIRKINFIKAFAQKFNEYDKKLKALTSINVFEVIKKAVQAKVLTELKKLLPNHIPKAVANYVKPRLNNLATIDAQDVDPSFHKRTHDNQDPPNDREGENRKKKRKDAAEPSSRSSRKDKTPMVQAQDDTHKSGSANAKRRTTWFDLLLKLDIDQNEDHILGPSTVAMAKNLKELIQKDELAIAYLEGVGLEKLREQYKNDVELEYHVYQLKAESTKPHPSFYNNDFYYLVYLSTEEKYTTSITKHYAARYYIQGIEDMVSDIWSKEVHRYQIEALNGIHHWEDANQDFFKA
ncbi:hypothetical protein Tco_1247523, partial [Tanacetum coccineum]